MKLRLCPLILTLLVACAGARTTAAAPPVRQCGDAPPASRQPPQVDDLVSARIPVAYAEAGELARALRDIFDVHPDRGDVRVILHDHRASTLMVIATQKGIEQIRKILGPALSPPSAS
jgi:hypothetical protein